jgi:hypothetical protein
VQFCDAAEKEASTVAGPGQVRCASSAAAMAASSSVSVIVGYVLTVSPVAGLVTA